MAARWSLTNSPSSAASPSTPPASYHESGTKSGHLYYGIYQFPIRDGRNRYLFYRNNTLSKNSEPSLTLIYMEGTATLETLKRTFSK